MLAIPIGTSALFVFVLLALWLRGTDMRSIGLKRPERLRFVLLLGIGTGIGAPIVASLVGFLILTLLKPLIGTQTQDLSLFSNMLGHNIPALLGWLAVTWSFAAFGEEIVYRGYLMSRMSDLVGTSRWGWGISLLVSSIIFSLSHAYQGPAGMIQSGTLGLVFGSVYLIARRNLWANILCHGINDSLNFLLLFFFLVAR